MLCRPSRTARSILVRTPAHDDRLAHRHCAEPGEVGREVPGQGVAAPDHEIPGHCDDDRDARAFHRIGHGTVLRAGILDPRCDRAPLRASVRRGVVPSAARAGPCAAARDRTWSRSVRCLRASTRSPGPRDPPSAYGRTKRSGDCAVPTGPAPRHGTAFRSPAPAAAPSQWAAPVGTVKLEGTKIRSAPRSARSAYSSGKRRSKQTVSPIRPMGVSTTGGGSPPARMVSLSRMRSSGRSRSKSLRLR